MCIENIVPFHHFPQTERVGEIGVKRSATATMSEHIETSPPASPFSFLTKIRRGGRAIQKPRKSQDKNHILSLFPPLMFRHE